MYKKYMGNTESTGCDTTISSHKVVKVSDELTPLMKTNYCLKYQEQIRQINEPAIQAGFTTIRLREFEAGFCLLR